MRCASTVSVTFILDAIQHYTKLGYQLIDVPQCVDFDVSQHTKPKGVPELFHRGNKVYVASAEQSFLQLHKNRDLPNGKYMALTPCYRHEAFLDDTHYSMFLKLELIELLCMDSFPMIDDANNFFNKYLPIKTKCVETQEAECSFDIETSCGVEVGSYGVRYTLDGTPYVYGTGIAEPRFSSLVHSSGDS
jgi:hypothetical protein